MLHDVFAQLTVSSYEYTRVDDAGALSREASVVPAAHVRQDPPWRVLRTMAAGCVAHRAP